ncbi:hypothetical protein [Marinomonas atlantica]|uniref:hypothetical protein n=1 Tax=Marinomonas atlantica TaxID=1806668 RepID=UPI00083101C7|nr:hypothetical protein [Marinomonas atlantica]
MSEALDLGDQLLLEAFAASQRSEAYTVRTFCKRAQELHEQATAPLRDGLEKIKSFVPRTQQEKFMHTIAIEALKGDKA